MSTDVCSEIVNTERDRQAEKIKSLESENKTLRKERIGIENVKEWIEEYHKEAAVIKPPAWVSGAKKKKGQRSIGTPVLMLSDMHHSEVVDPAQVNGVNEYNLDIALARLAKCINTTELLLKRYINSDYPGIVVMLAGDMLSGDIHEELKETNEVSTLSALLDLQGHLGAALVRLANVFGKVHVVSVVGNHTRTTLKPRAKGAVSTSYDWLLGQELKIMLADDTRITLDVSDSLDAMISIYGIRFNLTHGDQFRGGGGIQGALSPWFIGDYRKRKRQRAIGQDYDYLCMGHWHQRAEIGGIIVNGSIKGYDEYAYRMNMPYEPPQQWLFIVHPEKGINYRIPVILSSDKQNKNREWFKVG
jgi:predicted phosphodiesterase